MRPWGRAGVLGHRGPR